MTNESGDNDVRKFLRDEASSTVVPAPPVADLLGAGAKADRSRSRLVVGVVAAVVLGAIGTGFAIANRPSESAAPSPINPAPVGQDCPQLLADTPSDLTDRRVHVAVGAGTPAAVGVIWSDGTSKRVLNVSAAPTDEEYGDGSPITPTKIRVQDVEGEEIVDGDVRRVLWKSPTATSCPYWGVVAGGLSEKELIVVLESVREPGAPKVELTPESLSESIPGPTTACSDLPAIPTDQEIDTNLDPETRRVTVSFNRDGTDKLEQYNLDYASDETCSGRADVIKIVARALDSVDAAGTHPPTLDVTSDGASAADLELAGALILFNREPTDQTLAALNISPVARLTLGQGMFDRVLNRASVDKRRWSITPETYFRGGTGGFSVLDTLDAYRVTNEAPKLVVSQGPHPRCVGPNIESRGNERFRQISIQPAPESIDSCLHWFSIDLYIDAEGMVETIDLDRYEP